MYKISRFYLNFSFLNFVNFFLSFFRTSKFHRENTDFFLKILKKKINTNNLLLTSQGRIAAFNIFKLLVNDQKNEFIITPYTLAEVINAIRYANGIPVFVDIDLNTGLPKINEVKKKINKKTCGIILTQLFSSEEDINFFKKNISDKIFFIEDNAINFLGKYRNNKFYGTLFDFGFFSFNYMKILPTFHGGLLYAKNKTFLKKINKNLINSSRYPIFKAINLVSFCLIIKIFFNKFIFSFFTYNILSLLKFLKLNFHEKYIYPSIFPKFSKTMPKYYKYEFFKNFSSSGIINLKNINKDIEIRKKKSLLYQKYLNKKLILKKYKNINNNVFNEYPILLKKNDNTIISSMLFDKGFDIRKKWYLDTSIFYKKKNNDFNFPNASYLEKYLLCLPTNKNFKEMDIKKICYLINKYED